MRADVMPDDFDSLPPALRRKFFSAVPRRKNLRRRNAGTLNRKRRLEGGLPTALSQKPRHSGSADLQCLHSLPPKIQRIFLSPEELVRLRQSHRQSDSETTTATRISQSSTLYLESSDSDWESDDDDDDMDHSLYDSFRWLDDDGDLDLTLAEYHRAHIAVPKQQQQQQQQQQPRRKPSSRRTMSFGTANRARKATTSSISIPTSSQSSTLPSTFATNKVGRRSTSRPPSGQQRPALHGPRASTSSIDPTAQYYQEPEARLKLRVYLASPQKFDEAIEFGFPSLDGKKDENGRPGRPGKIPERTVPPKPPKVTGTFFEDEDGSVHGQRNDRTAHRKSSRLSLKAPQNPPPSQASSDTKRQSSMAAARRIPGDREMTLKMTLTRPDLRTNSPSASPTSAEDPLKLADLPPVSPQIWDSDSDDQNVMKKMWRKLKQRC